MPVFGMKAIIHKVAVGLILFCAAGGFIPPASANMSVVVLTTRDVEIEAIADALACAAGELEEFARRVIYRFECDDMNVRIVRCGAGIVNGVLTAQLMIDHFRPDLMLSVGLCAALDDTLTIGDIVVAETFDRHDIGTHTDAGFVHGTAWYRKTRIHVDELMPHAERWSELRAAFTAPGESPFIPVCLVTGDSFIRSSLKRSWLQHKLGAQVVDMSGAALAAVAEANRVPLLVIRKVSDLGDSNAGTQFGRSASLSARDLGELVANVLAVWTSLEQGGTP